jgi:hypothetical protein
MNCNVKQILALLKEAFEIEKFCYKELRLYEGNGYDIKKPPPWKWRRVFTNPSMAKASTAWMFLYISSIKSNNALQMRL